MKKTRRKISRSDAPPGSGSWPAPWVQLRSASYHPFIYRRMIGTASANARSGDVVAVFDRAGERFGSGFYNPRSQIALRMVSFDGRTVDGELFRGLLESAVRLRRDRLSLDERASAYRVFHSEGDGISGLVVDRFADVLAVEVFSLGVQRRLEGWIPTLHSLCGTSRTAVRADPEVAAVEGFPAQALLPLQGKHPVRIQEYGVQFEVDLEEGHKTGFFCDQRENRRRFADRVRDLTVLDLCCYTGGFAIHAAVHGGAGEVTGVDLDEKAIERARRNAGLNQARVRWVHADAFSWTRQMQRNQKLWGAVVADPPKFIRSRGEFDEGRKKYFDLNLLAVSLVEPGGLLVTCSCSGLMPQEEFEKLVSAAAHRAGRRLQFLEITGAGPDHPVMSNCPESRYLKVIWGRVI